MISNTTVYNITVIESNVFCKTIVYKD